MASTDARPIPQKNVAYRITFPIFDADGDLVTGATGLDSEVSKDAGAFADCTNEATEIATSSGMYYLDLSNTEMNADTVAVIVKTTSTGAKTTPIVMYPEEAGDIRVNVTAYGGTAGTFASGRPEVNTTHAAGTAWASGAITSGVFASGAITSTAIAADAIGASELAADAVAEIADAVWDEDATGHQTQGTFGQAIGDPVADADTIWGLVNTNLNATVSSRASQTSLDTVDDLLDTEVAAIKTVVDGIQTDLDNATDGLGALKTAITAVDDFVDTEVAAIKTVVDAIEVDTQNIQSRIPAALTVDGNIKADTLRVGGTLQTAGDIPAMVTTVDDFLDTEVAAILADTNELQTDWANGGRLDLILDARASQTSVDTIDDFLDTEVSAIKAKTDQLTFTVANQVDSNALSGGGGLDAAGVRAAVGLASANLDTQLTAIDDFLDTEIGAIKAKTDNLPADPADASDIAAAFTSLNTKVDTIDDFLDTEVAAVKTVTDKLDSALELDGAVYRYTTNALEQAPTGGSAPTVAQIADAVWDEDTTGHTTAGTFGEQLKTDVDAILVDTGTTLDGKLDVIDDFLDTEVAAIKAKTDNLPADPADASDITSSFSTVNTKLDTIDDFLDTEVAAIKAKTDNLPASPAATGDIQVGVEAALDEASVELGSVPATTGSLRQMIQFLHSYFRNKKTVTTSTETLMKEDASTTLGSASISDDGSTFTKGEMN